MNLISKLIAFVLVIAGVFLAGLKLNIDLRCYMFIPISLLILFHKQIVEGFRKIKILSKNRGARDKLIQSYPSFLNFAIACLLSFALYRFPFSEESKVWLWPIALGFFLIISVIMMKRMNELLLAVFLPRVKKTSTVLDDQLLLFTFASLKYSIIPIAVYLWAVYGFGVEISPYAKTGFAISIAAIGFAFRNIINDFLASVIINIEQEIMIKDYITVNDKTGKIWKIEPRYTVLKSLKGEEFIIPNSDLINNAVINHSRRRFISIYMTFSLNRDEDIDVENLRRYIMEICADDFLIDTELGTIPQIEINLTDYQSTAKVYTISFQLNSSMQGSGKVIFAKNLKTERMVKEKIFNYVHKNTSNKELTS